MARDRSLDINPILWILALVVASIVICDVVTAINSSPSAPDQRGGIMGRVFRWVLYQTVFGQPATPQPMGGPCHAPAQLAPSQPKSGDFAGGKHVDHGEGW